ncbi:MAG TPA: GntR family transcriptional regulator [Streptosporangiaceae bacterium]|jgi:DNA-binding GntR family transcriptional regulator
MLRAKQGADTQGATITSLPSGTSSRARRGSDELRLRTVTAEATLTSRAYEVLREAIAEMPIYDDEENDTRLDERALAQRLGISRTPVREALLRLENEGVVHAIPRRGIYVVRKTKAEIIEVILASAALEGMAARLAAERATDQEIADLLAQFPQFDRAALSRADGDGHRAPAAAGPVTGAGVSEYSQVNLNFHQRIAELAHSELFSQHISRLQIHMRAIRHRTISDSDRIANSVVDHADIVEALQVRDGDLAEDLVRRHALGLAEHVRDNVSYLK